MDNSEPTALEGEVAVVARFRPLNELEESTDQDEPQGMAPFELRGKAIEDRRRCPRRCLPVRLEPGGDNGHSAIRHQPERSLPSPQAR